MEYKLLRGVPDYLPGISFSETNKNEKWKYTCPANPERKKTKDVNSDGTIFKKEMNKLIKDMYGLLKSEDPNIAGC